MIKSKLLYIILCMVSVIAAGGTCLAAENTVLLFDVITEVTGYGQNSAAIVIDAEKEVDGTTLSNESFTVETVNVNPVTHETVFEGTRNIVDVYVNDSAVPGDHSENGKYMIIEMETYTDGPTVDGASSFEEDVELEMSFTVTQRQDFGYSDGTIESTDSVGYEQENTIHQTVEDFIYGIGEVGNAYPYRLFIPEKKDGEKYPLVVWLHGAGECGTDNIRQLISNQGGTAWASSENQQNNPCYVLVPQTSSDEESWSGERVVSLVEEIRDLYSDIDDTRIYIAGCSMGGLGTLRTLLCQPEMFAAALVICPALIPEYNHGDEQLEVTEELFSGLVNTPVWLFHSADDPVIPVSYSRDLYNVMEQAGCNVSYTEVETVPYFGHFMWVPVLSNDILNEDGQSVFEWLYSFDSQISDT